MDSRRLKCVPIDLDMVALLFVRPPLPFVYIEDQLPEGAKYEHSYVDFATNSLRLLYSHPDWPEVPYGEYPPTHSPLFVQRHDAPKWHTLVQRAQELGVSPWDLLELPAKEEYR